MLKFYSLSCTKSFFVTPGTGHPIVEAGRRGGAAGEHVALINNNLTDFYSGERARLRRTSTWEPRDKWLNINKVGNAGK